MITTPGHQPLVVASAEGWMMNHARGGSLIEIIDGQLHVSETTPVRRPGALFAGTRGDPQGYFRNEQAIVAMDAVGVDAALLIRIG